MVGAMSKHGFQKSWMQSSLVKSYFSFIQHFVGLCFGKIADISDNVKFTDQIAVSLSLILAANSRDNSNAKIGN